MQAVLTVEELREILHYDPATGIWTWLKTLAWRGPAGSRAGAVLTDGYRVIGIKRKYYRSSRLAFFYMTGRWPVADIDHKNLDRSDDRWLNLREATRTQNNGNFARGSTNKSGYKGVSWSKQTNKWAAFIHVKRKTRYLGSFARKEDAAAAYAHAANQFFGEFARTE